VATVALDGATNAGILAAQILATADAQLLQNIINYKNGLKEKVLKSAADLGKK
jgi:5-(carboxyamino)imidazole ribonucleotide mutase